MSNQKVVRISNALVRCVQQLKVSDKRLLMLLISNSNNSNIDGLITATAKEYASVYGVSTSCAYKEMPVSHARIRALEFDIDGVSSNWFISRLTVPIEGQVDVRIHPDIKHHINELKKHYTQYYLRRAGNFKSIYSWRLFELLMQFRRTGILKISVPEFKEILEIPKSYDKHFALVRHNVINAALKEIKTAGLPVVLKTEKRGRSIHMLIFTFPLEQQRDWIPADFEAIKARYLGKHAKAGESQQAAEKRLHKELKQLRQEEQHQKSA